MKRAIIPPTLLTVSHTVPLKIIATKSTATVIRENETAFWSVTKIVSINNATKEIKMNLPDTILSTEPDWYSHYE
ncbi:MAG: hypothetical protein HYX40_12475 [Sphingobacteriales bacterium]|nr:hypothetical protein [Sphingobacteriales bacterium]